MPGQAFLRLIDAANDQYGYVTIEDAAAAGVNSVRLAQMGRRGQLERVTRGLYRVPTHPRGPLDLYLEAALWPRGLGVLSDGTALDLLDLCDVDPARIHITVPKAYRNWRAETPKAYIFHRRDLDPADVTRHEGIPIVTAARAILDGIASRLGDALIDQAIDTAARRGLLTAEQRRAITRARQSSASAAS